MMPGQAKEAPIGGLPAEVGQHVLMKLIENLSAGHLIYRTLQLQTLDDGRLYIKLSQGEVDPAVFQGAREVLSLLLTAFTQRTAQEQQQQPLLKDPETHPDTKKILTPDEVQAFFAKLGITDVTAIKDMGEFVHKFPTTEIQDKVRVGMSKLFEVTPRNLMRIPGSEIVARFNGMMTDPTKLEAFNDLLVEVKALCEVEWRKNGNSKEDKLPSETAVTGKE